MKLLIDIPEDAYVGIISSGYFSSEFNMIKALKESTPLEDIRAEIEGLTYYWCEVNPKSVIDDVLQIIDKYRNEVNE